MSIIHDALKKAEREREPHLTGLRLHSTRGGSRRRWRWHMLMGMLVGLTAVGAVSTWLGLHSRGGGLPTRTAMPAVQASPGLVWEGEDQSEPPVVVSQSLPTTKARALAGPLPFDSVPSPAVPRARALEAKATDQTAFERAREAEFRGQWDEAKRQYRRALALNPMLVEARNNLGTLYVRQQQLAAAIDEFQAAIRLAPNYAIARNNLGSAYFLSGQEAQAVQEFLLALHIDGEYVSPLYNLATLYARRSDVDQTVAFLTRALAIEPAVLSWLQEDPDFDGIKAAPEIQRLFTQRHAER